MEYLRQIEEDLTSLGNEAKKRHPEIKDSTDRAIATLKIIRETYVSEVMRKTASTTSKKFNFPQSSDLIAPYILTCNYAEASSKIVSMALNGIQLLLNYDIVPPADVKNILRVLIIQANSGRAESQLKLLQIILQLANFLSRDSTSTQYLTESVICGFLTISVQLCDIRNNVSVSSTAFATTRQIVTIAMNGVKTLYDSKKLTGEDVGEDTHRSPIDADFTSASITISAQMMVKDLSLFARGQPGEWIKGCYLALPLTLDLIYDILIEWKGLFTKVPIFQVLVKEFLFLSMKSLFKGLQEDFCTVVSRNGLTSASSITSRIVRIARCFLVDYAVPKWLLLEEFDLIVTFLVHALQPDCGTSVSTNVDRLLAPSLSSNRNLVNDQFGGYSVGSTGLSNLSSLPIAGAIMSRLNLQTGVQGMASNLGKAINNFQGGLQPGAGVSSTQSSGSLSYMSLSVSSTTSNLIELGTAVEKPNFIPSHPAGCCLEGLLSFFLSEAPIELLKDARGCSALGNAITAIVISASTVLKSALIIPSNVESFEDKIKTSSTVLMVDKLLTGGTANTSALVKALDDLVSSSTLDPADVLVLSFQLLQVITRFVTKLTFATYKHHEEWSTARTRLFLDETSLSQYHFYNETQLQYIHLEICNICENVIENLQDSCIICLKFADSDYVVEKSLMIIAEIGLITSISGIQKQCDQATSQLCKFTQPIWNSEDLHEVDYVAESGSLQQLQSHAPINSNLHLVRKRHVLAVLRSVQLVSAVANKISEWDSIVSSFEQIQRFYVIQNSSSNSDEINDNDVKKVLGILDRFRRFTIFLSSESLVRLMTALVVTSLNSLSSNNAGSNQASDGLSRISYSLLAVVEITKLNSFRASCIWQMVTSHLRMLASMKSPIIRSYAVNATLEIIHATFEGPIDIKNLFPSFKESEIQPAEVVLASEILPISDKFLYGNLLPSIENCFEPTRVHKDILRQRSIIGVREPSLSQEDLLSSLKSLSTVRYDDLRFKIISGVFNMIHTRGHILRGGWVVLIELFQSVPNSMIKPNDDTVGKAANEIDEDAKEFENSKWPRLALPHTFQCVKFLVDDFLDLMSTDIMKLLIYCLASFGKQSIDSNISLSSVETIWKLYDCILLKSKLSTSTQNSGSEPAPMSQNNQMLEVTASQLLDLSLDERPEIRNSALNSVFTLLNRNVSRIPTSEWQKLFESIIFPLCDQVGLRFSTALHEEMLTPELKKGVKMTVHHSRDTTFKQWSETRSLALLGLEQVLMTSTRFLLTQPWFQAVWIRSLGVCKAAIQDSSHDAEVSQTGVTLLFSMLKMSQGSKQNTTVTDSHNLWTFAWNSLKDASTFSSPSSELALQMCQSLSSFYTENISDFKNASSLKAFLEVLVIISRPRFFDVQDDFKATLRKTAGLNAQQLQKAVMLVLKSIQLSSFSSFCHFCSALAEICFSTTVVELFSPLYNELIDLGPCPEKLRLEIGAYLVGVLKAYSVPGDILQPFHAKNPFIMCDIITGRLLHDNFAALVASRAMPGDCDVQNLHRSANAIWAGQVDVDGDVIELNKFSHAFNSSEVSGGATWDGYVICTFEIDILLELFEYVLKQKESMDVAAWQNIVKVSACMLSPWQHRELSKEKYSSEEGSTKVVVKSYDAFVTKMTAYLDSLFDLAFQEKLQSPETFSDLIDAVCLSARLIVDSITKSLTRGGAPKSNATLRFASVSVQAELEIIVLIRKKLIHVINSSNRHISCRCRSLEGYLKITSGMVQSILSDFANISSLTVTQEDFIYECNNFLENLIALELDFTFIPQSFDATIMSLQNSGNILEDWMTTFQKSKTSISSTTPSSSYQKSNMLKSHLFLMLPLAVNLGTCRWITLQKTAHEIISVLNLPGFISNFNELLHKIEQLEEENRLLKLK